MSMQRYCIKTVVLNSPVLKGQMNGPWSAYGPDAAWSQHVGLVCDSAPDLAKA